VHEFPDGLLEVEVNWVVGHCSANLSGLIAMNRNTKTGGSVSYDNLLSQRAFRLNNRTYFVVWQGQISTCLLV
jgi:hypothetical protein